MKKILLAIVFFAALPIAMLAQTPNMMAMAQAELQKRGLDETEVRARLLQEGIDVDNIPPTEYANYQSRVLSVLNKMQAEKASATTSEAAAVTGGSEVVETANEMPLTTSGEAAAEAALEVALEENNVSPTASMCFAPPMVPRLQNPMCLATATRCISPFSDRRRRSSTSVLEATEAYSLPELLKYS